MFRIIFSEIKLLLFHYCDGKTKKGLDYLQGKFKDNMTLNSQLIREG